MSELQIEKADAEKLNGRGFPMRAEKDQCPSHDAVSPAEPLATVTATVEIPAISDFAAVLRALSNGKQATRSAWLQSSVVGLNLDEPCPYLYCQIKHIGEYGLRSSWSPSIEDLFATDWAILPN
jgi:hypothetical protein